MSLINKLIPRTTRIMRSNGKMIHMVVVQRRVVKTRKNCVKFFISRLVKRLAREVKFKRKLKEMNNEQD